MSSGFVILIKCSAAAQQIEYDECIRVINWKEYDEVGKWAPKIKNIRLLICYS